MKSVFNYINFDCILSHIKKDNTIPVFFYKNSEEFYDYFFNDADNFNMENLLDIINNLKNKFVLLYPDNIDEITGQTYSKNYKEFIFNDMDDLNFDYTAHFGTMATAYYNFILYNNKQYLDKYQYLRTKNKIKFYYVKDNTKCNFFGYIRQNYPTEFAPEMDLDKQFGKNLVNLIKLFIRFLKLEDNIIIKYRLNTIKTFLNINK